MLSLWQEWQEKKQVEQERQVKARRKDNMEVRKIILIIREQERIEGRR